MKPQTTEEIIAGYDTEDPWGYKTNPEDARRKFRILEVAKLFGPYDRAIDLGAGEGWIATDLPAKKIFGFELSDKAASRFPKNVTRAVEPAGKYDLVLACGVLYPHYDYRRFLAIINERSSRIIITSSIKAGETPEINNIEAKQIFEAEFSYREYTQKLRVFKR